jgi:hypothetical protein
MRDAMRLPIAMVAAGVVGHVAYLSPNTLYLLAAFPLLLTWSRHRWGAVLAAWGFFLGPCLALIGVLKNWVASTGQPLSAFEIHGYPVLLSALLALPFLLVNPAAAPLRRAMQMAVALVILTVPPLGFIAWINPLMLAAALFPGAGILVGLALALVAIGLLTAHAWQQSAHPAARISLAVVLVGVLGAHSLETMRPDPLPPVGWYGVDTKHPPGLMTPESRDFRAALIAAQAAPFLEFPETSLLVFPESVLPEYEHRDIARLQPLIDGLTSTGAKVLLGATTRTGPEAWRNQILILDRDGARPLAETRIPVPVGNWQLGGTGVPLDGLASSLVDIEGVVASVTICYEELPLWSHRNADEAEVMVSAANLWMLNPSVLRYQRTAIAALARLARKPLVRAENRLPSSQS